MNRVPPAKTAEELTLAVAAVATVHDAELRAKRVVLTTAAMTAVFLIAMTGIALISVSPVTTATTQMAGIIGDDLTCDCICQPLE